jgi:polyvinyl alcohol dehydrogenase (cytochrome)
MRLSRHFLSSLVAATAFLVVLTSTGVPASEATTANWPGYLFDNGHSSKNAAATAITPANAAHLHKAWTFKPHNQAGQPSARQLGSPVVVNGVVFLASFSGTLYALDETTGAVDWSANIGFTPAGACASASGPTSTPLVAPDPSRSNALTVYVAGGDGILYAFDASDGSLVWKTPVAATNGEPTEFIYMAPTLVDGALYLGVATNCEPPLAPGRVVELAQSSGAIVNTYRAVAADSGGGAVWVTPASDGTSLWVTTGNADQTGVQPPGDSFSFVRLAVNDLSKQDIWTVTPSLDGSDYDFGSSPTLFSATIAGTSTQMVGACNKNGTYYALAAQDLAAGPVWARVIGTHRGGGPTCIASAIWDRAKARLILASNATKIGGKSFPGSLRSVDPATGAYRWQLGVAPGPIQGTPTEDGAGVIAAATSDQTGKQNQLYLVNATTGKAIKKYALPALEYAQPVFADGFLFSATVTGGITAYAP